MSTGRRRQTATADTPADDSAAAAAPGLGQRVRLGLLTALLVLIADQASKLAILELMRPDGVTATPFVSGKVVNALPVLDYVLTWNRGISFGLGNVPGSWNVAAFSALALVISLFLLRWLVQADSLASRLALGLVLGGAIGNVIDRIRYGAVVDFLYAHWGRFDWWPAFNVADSAICIGAGLLVLDALFHRPVSHKNSP